MERDDVALLEELIEVDERHARDRALRTRRREDAKSKASSPSDHRLTDRAGSDDAEGRSRELEPEESIRLPRRPRSYVDRVVPFEDRT
jgi:hypothetical protein